MSSITDARNMKNVGILQMSVFVKPDNTYELFLCAVLDIEQNR